MILYRVIDPVDAMAFSAPVFPAILSEEVRHFLSDPGQPLTVGFRCDTQNIPRDSAVHFEHGTQDENAPAFRIQALEHHIRTGKL